MAFCLLVLCWEVGSPPAPKNFKKVMRVRVWLNGCVCVSASWRFAVKVEPVKYAVKWADLFSRVTCNFYESERKASYVSLNSIHYMFILALNFCNFFISQKNSHMLFMMGRKKREGKLTTF